MKYPVIPSLLLAASLAPLAAAEVPLALIGLTPDTGSSPYDGLTNAAAGTIRGLALPGLAVTVKVDATVVGIVEAGADGGWSLPLAIPLADGSHSISVAAAGIGTRTATQSIRIDTAAPRAATWTSLAPDSGRSATDWVTAAADVVVNGKAEAGAQLALTLDGVALPVLAVPANGSWQLPLAAVPDGDHVLTASVSDLAGNLSPLATRSLRIDHAAPAAPVIATMSTDTGSSASDRLTRDDTPTFSGASEPDAQVSILCDGVPAVGVRASAAGAWRVTTPQIAAGSHVFTAIATDAAGNVSASSADFAMVIKTSTIVPSVAITTDTGVAGDFITSDKTLVYTGDAAPGDQVALSLDGKVVARAYADATGRFSIDRARYPLADGSHAVLVTATDAAGNVASAPAMNLVVDTVAPVLDAFQIGGADPTTGIVDEGGPMTVWGITEPGTSVEIDIDGVAFAVVPSPTSNTWSFTGQAPAAGQHVVHARAVDAAGNASQTVARDLVVTSVVVVPPQQVTVRFQAVVTNVANDLGLLHQLPVGMPVSGSYVYHLGQVDADLRPGFGEYLFAQSGEGFRLQIGTYDFRSKPSQPSMVIRVADAQFAGQADQLTIADTAIIEPSGLPTSTVSWDLSGPLGLGLNGDALPTGAPDLQFMNGPMVISGPISAITGAPAYSITMNVIAASADAGQPTGDTTPPAAPMINVIGGGLPPTVGVPVTVAGSAEAGATIHLLIDGSESGLVQADAQGIWSLSSVFATQGLHLVSAFAVDAAGNVGTGSPAMPVQVQAASMPGPIVTVVYTAVVEAVDDLGGLVPGILPGMQVSGSYAYRTGVADGNALAQVGDYRFSEPGLGLRATVGIYDFRSHPQLPNLLLELTNDYGQQDAYVVQSYSNIEIGGHAPIDVMSWQLSDPTQTAIASTDLTADPPSLLRWQGQPGLTLGGTSIGGVGQLPMRWQVRARIVDVHPAVAPPADTTPPPAPTGLAFLVEREPTRTVARADDRITISGRAEAGARVDVLRDGLSIAATTAAADGSWACPGLGFDAGSVVLTAQATDSAGNVSPQSQPLILDIQPVVVADPVTITFTAVADLVADATHATGVLPGQILTGTMTFRPGAAGTAVSPTVSEYHVIEPGLGMRIVTPSGLVLSSSAAAPDLYLRVANDDLSGDGFSFNSYRNIDQSGRTVVETMNLNLSDPTRLALTSTQLPATLPSPALWPGSCSLDLMGSSPIDPLMGRWQIHARIVTIVNEPPQPPGNG